MVKKMIYLDNSATTRVAGCAAAKINQINTEIYANPSSLHNMGLKAEEERESARKTIAKSISANPKNIIFTSGGTEANNLAISGYLLRNRHAGRRIITSAAEHASVFSVFEHFEAQGYEVCYVPYTKQGGLDYEFLRNSINEDTALVSIMSVNNETGAIFDTARIKKIILEKNRNTLFHSDCVQAYMKTRINVKTHGADMISLSSHKINGPKGTGALYVEDYVKLSPLIIGGGQEGNIRSGTENLSGICGFAEAAKLNQENNEEKISHIRSLRNELLKRIETLPHIHVNSEEEGAAHILNVSFLKLRSEIMLHSLEMKGIYVSSGSACSSNFKGKKSVLSRMGFEKAIYDSAIRFSFSYENTMEEIEETFEAIKKILSSMSR